MPVRKAALGFLHGSPHLRCAGQAPQACTPFVRQIPQPRRLSCSAAPAALTVCLRKFRSPTVSSTAPRTAFGVSLRRPQSPTVFSAAPGTSTSVCRRRKAALVSLRGSRHLRCTGQVPQGGGFRMPTHKAAPCLFPLLRNPQAVSSRHCLHNVRDKFHKFRSRYASPPRLHKPSGLVPRTVKPFGAVPGYGLTAPPVSPATTKLNDT